MVKPEIPLKRKDQIRLDEELALKLQAEEEDQARLAREKAKKIEEANISWDNTQAMMEANRLLAERLQVREQEELTYDEKARLFVELLEKRKKHFAALRAQENRNKPQTKAQKKSTMSTYLKHMAGYKQSQLKNNLKKVKAEMIQESSSKRAEDDDIVEATPLSVKIPIVDYTIHRKGKLDLVWRLIQGKTILLWRLYDSCGIHFVRFKDMHVYMLVEKRYPLRPATITAMLNRKLQADDWNAMTYQLLKLLTKQLNKQ
ncbi:hypothetical protein Tco_1107573 [Tanacetum coccineum]